MAVPVLINRLSYRLGKYRKDFISISISFCDVKVRDKGKMQA